MEPSCIVNTSGISMKLRFGGQYDMYESKSVFSRVMDFITRSLHLAAPQSGAEIKQHRIQLCIDPLRDLQIAPCAAKHRSTIQSQQRTKPATPSPATARIVNLAQILKQRLAIIFNQRHSLHSMQIKLTRQPRLAENLSGIPPQRTNKHHLRA